MGGFIKIYAFIVSVIWCLIAVDSCVYILPASLPVSVHVSVRWTCLLQHYQAVLSLVVLASCFFLCNDRQRRQCQSPIPFF